MSAAESLWNMLGMKLLGPNPKAGWIRNSEVRPRNLGFHKPFRSFWCTLLFVNHHFRPSIVSKEMDSKTGHFPITCSPFWSRRKSPVIDRSPHYLPQNTGIEVISKGHIRECGLLFSELRKRHQTDENIRCSEYHDNYLGIPSENKGNLLKSFQQERDPTRSVFKWQRWLLCDIMTRGIRQREQLGHHCSCLEVTVDK